MDGPQNLNNCVARLQKLLNGVETIYVREENIRGYTIVLKLHNQIGISA